VQGEDIVKRLIQYLVLEDVHERRAAVQTLGMIGQKVLKPLTDLLLTTEDRLVRSSCSKAIGAVALKNPELLPDFPQDALDGMKKAIMDIPDPVTKIATIASLGQIGGGDMTYGYPGCERALDVLIEALSVTEDMGLAAAAVNAVATIGNSNEAFRPKAVACLEALKKRASAVDGFFFVEQIVDSNLENLNGGGLVGELSRGRSSDSKAWLASASRQVDKAASSGMIKNPGAAPPAPSDDWMSKL
jgi:HEAT repeat protein